MTRDTLTETINKTKTMKPALTETSQPGDISPTTPTTTPAKRGRKPKAKSARAPRVIDPAIAQIRAEAKQRVAAHKLAMKSGAVLARIESACAKLTPDDKAKLAQRLTNSLTEIASAS